MSRAQKERRAISRNQVPINLAFLCLSKARYKMLPYLSEKKIIRQPLPLWSLTRSSFAQNENIEIGAAVIAVIANRVPYRASVRQVGNKKNTSPERRL